jgi:predicted nucleotidyltransferase
VTILVLEESIMKKENVISAISGEEEDLRTKFSVASLSLFGSVARDEAGPERDIDLLVEFSEPVGLFKFIELKNYLEALLDCQVDLGTPRSLKLNIKDKVLKEAIRVT